MLVGLRDYRIAWMDGWMEEYPGDIKRDRRGKIQLVN